MIILFLAISPHLTTRSRSQHILHLRAVIANSVMNRGSLVPARWGSAESSCSESHFLGSRSTPGGTVLTQPPANTLYVSFEEFCAKNWGLLATRALKPRKVKQTTILHCIVTLVHLKSDISLISKLQR